MDNTNARPRILARELSMKILSNEEIDAVSGGEFTNDTVSGTALASPDTVRAGNQIDCGTEE